MTRRERIHPEIIDGGRRLRIARGSGTSVADVNRLLKQFKQMKRMMKTLARGGSPGLRAEIVTNAPASLDPPYTPARVR